MDLTDSIVIVDEGHNLVDAVNTVHSAIVSRGQLATAKAALDTYFTRFSDRLAPGMHDVLSVHSPLSFSLCSSACILKLEEI